MKALIILLVLLLFSCKRESYVPIDVSTTENLAMSSQWAVITEPYVSYKEESTIDSAVSGYGRIGDVVEITGVGIGDDKELWYKFDSGWLPQKAIGIYTNKLQADFASQEYTK